MSTLTDIQKWPGGYCDICYALLMDTIETEARRCAKCRLAVVIAASTECAAGPWRTDVENAPKDVDLLCHIKNGGSVMVALGGTQRFRGNGWTILAFAVLNPPQVTT